MNDGDVMMMSPLSARGEQRLQRLRASIRQRFGSSAEVVRTLPPAHHHHSRSGTTAGGRSPRSRLRQRLAHATQLTSDEIFFQEFGSGEDLHSLDFDLVRADTPLPRANAAASTITATSNASSAVAVHTTSAFQSALPARSSIATHSQQLVSQLARPARVRTPKKVALKRSRVGESSAERAKPLQKPRLHGSSPSARSLAFSMAEAAAFQHERQPPTYPQKAASAAFYARASPSKLHFPSVSTMALFAQRQAPLR